jgi:sugar phosphate isomerase/epimerase
MMKVGMLSDELSPAPALACEMAALYGLKYLELRMWYHYRAPLGMNEQNMLDVRRTADSWGLQFCSISPGLFKLEADDPDLASHTGDFFDKCLDLCDALGAKTLVSFTPVVPVSERGKWDDALVESFRSLGDQAQARGILIAIENEPVCVASSAAWVVKLVGEISHPSVRMNYDPGNDAASAQGSSPEVWASVLPVMGHVHVKDYVADAEGHHIVDCGRGGVNWCWLMSQLKQIDYSGLLILEPHDAPQIIGAQRAILALRKLMAEAGVPWA